MEQTTIDALLQKPNLQDLEFRAVLPPSRAMAQIIASLANTEGGYLFLGIEYKSGNIQVHGLSQEFHATSITHKAIDLLQPKPVVEYKYAEYKGKKVYVIKVEKSTLSISLDNKKFFRQNNKIILDTPQVVALSEKSYSKMKEIDMHLEGFLLNSTASKTRLVEHYRSILRILDDLMGILSPQGVEIPTDNQEGKILLRILYSSFVDNFETYLSDLLYEIFLAKPETLKSDQKVTIEEVLNCEDLQDFVKYIAKQKIQKLQKGSVKGFIKDNKQIASLQAISNEDESAIERILQTRHLFTHRNGVVDEKFAQYFPHEMNSGIEYQISLHDLCDNLNFLSTVVENVDITAMRKFGIGNTN